MENSGSVLCAGGSLEVTELIRKPFFILMVRSNPEAPLNRVEIKPSSFIGILLVDRKMCSQTLWASMFAPLRNFENVS